MHILLVWKHLVNMLTKLLMHFPRTAILLQYIHTLEPQCQPILFRVEVKKKKKKASCFSQERWSCGNPNVLLIVHILLIGFYQDQIMTLTHIR